jgi:hypothetical protein
VSVYVLKSLETTVAILFKSGDLRFNILGQKAMIFDIVPERALRATPSFLRKLKSAPNLTDYYTNEIEPCC